MSHLNINGVDKSLDHIKLNNVRTEQLLDCIIEPGSISSSTGEILDGQLYSDWRLRTSDFIQLDAGMYTISMKNADQYVGFYFTYDVTTGTYIERLPSDWANFPLTFTLQSTQKVKFVFRYADTLQITPSDISDIMLNTGSTAKSYYPYLISKEAWEARTRVILHGLTNPLCGIGTYKDTLDLSTGALTRQIGKIVFDGTEQEWRKSTVHSGSFYISWSSLGGISASPVRCSHAYAVSSAPSYVYGTFISDANFNIRIRQSDTELAEWRQYLASEYSAGHPVTIWYVLETPETEQITLPSNLTGIVEGYLTQSSTPSPTSPVYPTANGTPEQSGTYSLDTGAYAIAWGRADTFTGTNSMSARGYGLPVKSWEIDGNSEQSGTPTPDNPIMPEFVGERTGNLSTQNYVNKGFNWSIGTISDTISTNRLTTMDFSDITGGRVTAAVYDDNSNSYEGVLFEYDSSGKYTGNYQHWYVLPYTWTVGANTKVRICVKRRDNHDIDNNIKIMLNAGSTALPYEPYGYKIPITCAGQTTPVYLGQVPTVRQIKKLVLDGKENWTLRSAGTGVFYIAITNYLKIKNVVTCICSHYPAQANVNGWVDVTDKKVTFYAGAEASKLLYIRDTDFVSADAFKQFLSDQYTAGTPVIVWYVLAEPETEIVNEPLAKIGTYADTLTSEQAGITVPTTDGNNIISVDTDLQPSEMTITAHIKDVWFSQKITGVPPLSFNSNALPLVDWEIDGNGQQIGTPTPDNPIMPEFVGDRTKNLCKLDTTKTFRGVTFTVKNDGTVAVSGRITSADESISALVSVYIYGDGDYIFSGCPEGGSNNTYYAYMWDYTAGTRCKRWDGTTSVYNETGFGQQVKIVSGHEVGYCIRVTAGVTYENLVFKPMIRKRSESSDFEPYGYKIPIICAGQTTPVYLRQTQTVRRVKKLVLTGEENDWNTYTLQDGSYCAFLPLQNFLGAASTDVPAFLICTHYICRPQVFIYNGRYESCCGGRTDRGILIRDINITSEQDLKLYLNAQYSAGTPVCVWYVLAEPETAIANEPLAKIGDYADELHSSDADVTIPTVRGENTLTVDTNLQPSSMTISGYIK